MVLSINTFDEKYTNLDQLSEVNSDAEFKALFDGLFFIPTGNAPALRQRLEKANRRARKCLVAAGLRSKEDKSDPLSLDILGLEKMEIEGHKVPCFVVKITGDLPHMEYDEFVAKIEHIFDESTKRWENIIHAVPGKAKEGELVAYRHYAPSCEHCHIERKRNDTFLIRSHGEMKQIGRNCLADYLGGMSWKLFSELAETLIDLSEACENARQDTGWNGDWGYKSSRMIDLEMYLEWVSHTMRLNGWVSKAKAREEVGLVSTAALAIADMNDYHRGGHSYTSPDQKDTDRVKQALDWVRSLSEDEIENGGDYIYNLNRVCKHDYLRWQHHGIAASLFAAYNKAMEKLAQKQNQPVSNWIGNVDDKVTVTVKVTGISYSEGDFGTKTVYQMLDEQTGNKFVWFSSSKKVTLEQNITYTLNGVIAKNDEWKGFKKTILTRCTLAK